MGASIYMKSQTELFVKWRSLALLPSLAFFPLLSHWNTHAQVAHTLNVKMWSRTVTAFVLPLLCLQGVGAINFPYESIQLTDDDVANHPELQFGNLNATRPNVTCRAWPGEAGWPSEAVWTAFNASLGGALIKPVPAAASCYSGASFNQATCARVQASFSNTSFQ